MSLLQKQCDLCPDGKSNSNDESTNCVQIPFGSYKELNSVEINTCQQGHSCAGGTQYKEKCKPGSAAENEGSAKCLSCTPGMYASSYESVTCSSCGFNYFANKPNQTSCKQCPNGKMTEKDQLGATSCQKCGAGTYGASCSKCAVGMFRSGSDDDATICKNCLAG